MSFPASTAFADARGKWLYVVLVYATVFAIMCWGEGLQTNIAEEHRPNKPPAFVHAAMILCCESTFWRTWNTSDGHLLCHSGNGIREWSGNRCVFAIPHEFPFPFPFPFPQNSFGGKGGSTHSSNDFPAKKNNKLRLSQWLKIGVTVVRGGRGGV